MYCDARDPCESAVVRDGVGRTGVVGGAPLRAFDGRVDGGAGLFGRGRLDPLAVDGESIDSGGWPAGDWYDFREELGPPDRTASMRCLAADRPAPGVRGWRIRVASGDAYSARESSRDPDVDAPPPIVVGAMGVVDR